MLIIAASRQPDALGSGLLSQYPEASFVGFTNVSKALNWNDEMTLTICFGACFFVTFLNLVREQVLEPRIT